jgi:RNA polymerase sigma-70 factor (ECF subfamily)
MARATGQPTGANAPTGLRALAELVAAALTDLINDGPARAVTPGAPALAALGPIGAFAVARESTSVPRAGHHLAGRRPRPRSAPPPPPPPRSEPKSGADPVSDEHAEVWELVQRAQQGDGEAFGQLYDRYADVVYRFIYFRVNDRALAEDFTSETFLRALRRISSISYQGRDIGAWFVTIARNIILDHVKSARNRFEITTSDTLEGPEREPSPEAAVLDLLTSERLMAAVRKLGDDQRECVMLRFIQGFSVSETAAVMGRNDGAIKALQHRAVRKLAELVGSELQ